MKGIKYLLAISLFLAVACSEQQPTNESLPPYLEIITANPMVVTAAGGDQIIEIEITNADNNLTISASCEAEWIRLKPQSSNETATTISFTVERNESQDARTATIVLTYDKDYEVVVNQVGSKVNPEDALSSLTNDVEMVCTGDDSLIYADLFGDDYNTGVDLWQFYIMNFVTKQQICLEVLWGDQTEVDTEMLIAPTGTFIASDDKWSEGTLMIGYIDEDGDGLYYAGSWYDQLYVEGVQDQASAPIADGSVDITYSEETDMHTITFDLLDDAGNRITCNTTGFVWIEDFR